ncbi:hypothetical protein [Polaromonas jejuensis]|uniref:Cyclic nucleotide-binding domain-containing protein n=1 Tax=Polaromonas jejuensis TaxID=457502 RepID=A0ABW0QFD3_9BURK|nr:hypothetical protein [Polaromonas jejuensis]
MSLRNIPFGTSGCSAIARTKLDDGGQQPHTQDERYFVPARQGEIINGQRLEAGAGETFFFVAEGRRTTLKT